MPLFELLRSQEKKSSAHEDDLVELVWENGQIAMQIQSSKSRNSPACTNSMPPRVVVQSDTSRTKEIGNGSDSPIVIPLNEIPISVPLLEPGLSQDDGSVPWLNESLQTGYCPDFFPDVSEVTVNEPDNDVNCNQPLASSHSVPVHDESTRHGRGTSQSSSSRSNLFQEPSSLYQIDRARNVHQIFCEESGCLSRKQLPELPNFSHHLLPAALAETNLHGSGAKTTREIGSTSGAASTRGSNHAETRILESGSSSKGNEKGCQISGNSCRRDRPGEMAVQSYSVCSVNHRLEERSLKRQHSGTRDMTTICREDVEEEEDEESTDARKAAPLSAGSGSGSGSGFKRSRSAEVHNLSERRRRDRINGKMRVLQELIPNCNKVDKASMLDEAIEHIKSLQLQIQIMSMASGYYVPPTIFTPGMQSIHTAMQMPRYPAMAMGMGMVMDHHGVGITPGMSCGSPRFPMVQVLPQLQALGLQPLSRPDVSMGRVPGGLAMSSPSEINGSAVAETGKVAEQTKETGSKDGVKNKSLESVQSGSSCSDVLTKQV